MDSELLLSCGENMMFLYSCSMELRAGGAMEGTQDSSQVEGGMQGSSLIVVWLPLELWWGLLSNHHGEAHL